MTTNRCSTLRCEKASSIYCYQCEENFCEEHYGNHQDKLKSRLSFLQDEKKFLNDQYRLLNANQLRDEYRRNLEEWRNQSHQIIEKMYTDKVDEAAKYFKDNFDRTEIALKTVDDRIVMIMRNPRLTHEAVQNIKEGNEYLKKKLQTIEEKKSKSKFRCYHFNRLPLLFHSEQNRPMILFDLKNHAYSHVHIRVLFVYLEMIVRC